MTMSIKATAAPQIPVMREPNKKISFTRGQAGDCTDANQCKRCNPKSIDGFQAVFHFCLGRILRKKELNFSQSINLESRKAL